MHKRYAWAKPSPAPMRAVGGKQREIILLMKDVDRKEY